MARKEYDLIIIGGGPAGVAAGIYAARYRLNVMLVSKIFGGQMARKAVGIENYPGFEKISGLDLIKKFEKQLKKQKIDVEKNQVVRIKKKNGLFSVLTSSKQIFSAKAVIAASGADPRPMEVPGEKKFIGKGVSYCTACDAPMYQGEKVAVIGGGNTGFEAALVLANYAEKVYILEFSKDVNADEENKERAGKYSNIEIITSAALKKIEGGKFVESLTYQDLKSKKAEKLGVGGIFVEIGSQPATSFLNGLVDFSERDEIKIDQKTYKTKTPGLFAAGDVTDVKYKQIVIAAGQGAGAALSAYEYLQKQ